MTIQEDLPLFECIACGKCCKEIENIPSLNYLYDHKKQSCIHLENNLCSIYEDRPDVCNYKKLYNLIKTIYSPTEYYEITVKLCNEIKSSEF